MGQTLLKEPWRDVKANYKENLNSVKSYQPRNKNVKQLSILFEGPVGAGKSSFINSVNSVLQNRITGRSLTDAISGGSFTEKYLKYKIEKGESYYSFSLNDTMGFESHANSGILVEDVKLTLRGHVAEGYRFNPSRSLTEGDVGYNSSPSLQDKIYVLVTVVPAGMVSLLSQELIEQMRKVRLAASDIGIPQFAILTKADEACPEVKKNVNNIYRSIYLKEQVESFHQKLGIPINCIFLVQNYSTEIVLNEGINAPIVCAVRQMIGFGEDFLNSQSTNE